MALKLRPVGQSKCAPIADAVVVGSRIVNEIENASENELIGRVKALVQDLRRGVDAASK